MKEAGYRTAIVGEWHLGHADREYWPRQRGFGHQHGPLLGEIDSFTRSAHGVRDWFRDNEPVKEEGYVTQLLGRDAVKLIEGHDPKLPLFLNLTFTAPHAPYQAPQEYLDRCKEIADPSRRAHAAMITSMDDEIGRVLAALEKRGMRESPLVVFQSDNGGPRSAKSTGEVDVSKSTIPADNAAFRDGKGSPYEGGTRVVAALSWPGHVEPGTVVDQPIHLVDMLPALASLAGASTAKCKPLDGLNVWPAIAEGEPSPRDEVVYGIEPFRATLRKGDFKLVWQTTLPSEVELFDLRKDPSEATNLAEQSPGKVDEPKRRADELARPAVEPLIFEEAFDVSWRGLSGSVALPGAAKAVEAEP